VRLAARLAAGALAAAGGMAFYSVQQANKPIPDEEEAYGFLRSFFRPFGLEYVMDRFSTDSISSDGVELKLYLFESSPGDPAAVFIPGTGVYALFYAEFLAKLSGKGYNVVGFDCRGHGMSTGKRGGYTMDQLVADTMNVVSYAEERYGDRVAVAGSSQGGIAAFYTAAADSRLKSAVCHNILAPDEPDNYRMTRYPGLYRRLIPLIPLMNLLPGELRVPVSLYLDLNSEPCRKIPDVGEHMKVDPMVVTTISVEALSSLVGTPMAVPVEQIEVPVMVVHSELDNIFPTDYVDRVFERLNCHKKMACLDKAPHLVLTDYVDEILPEITSWLDETLR
jgi:pimeloyl-ACP methyl ester carboxylesterase